MGRDAASERRKSVVLEKKQEEMNAESSFSRREDSQMVLAVGSGDEQEDEGVWVFILGGAGCLSCIH